MQFQRGYRFIAGFGRWDLVVRNGLVHFYAERGCLDLRVKCLIKVL